MYITTEIVQYENRSGFIEISRTNLKQGVYRACDQYDDIEMFTEDIAPGSDIKYL